MFKRAVRKGEESEPDTVKLPLQPELGEVSDTPPQPSNKAPILEKNLLMSDAIVNPEYVPDNMLGAWKAIMFQTAEGHKYIAHRTADRGYILTPLNDSDESKNAPITISREQARHILVTEEKQFICGELTLNVSKIIEKMRK